MKKLIILDRDGVINHDSLFYIKSPDEFLFIPGSIDAIACLTQAGYQIGIATNQSGISRGLYDHKGLAAIHEKMMTEINAAGGRIDAIEYCPHLPESGCRCRKPQAGLLKTIASRLNHSLAGVPFIGDRLTDIEAAKACGAKPILIFSPMTDRIGISAYPDVPTFISLRECVKQLLAEDE